MHAIASDLRRFWSLIPPRDKLVFVLLGGAGAGILGALLINAAFIQPAQRAKQDTLARENLHQIQLALERFAVDSDKSSYPFTATELLGTGYLAQMPLNPYTGQ